MNGIRYYEDMACRKPKYHTDGYKNLYVVNLLYVNANDQEKRKVISLPYGKYRLASNRYDIETSTDALSDVWLIDEINISADVYNGCEKVHSDVMLRVKFGTRNVHGQFSRNRVGEVVA